MHIENPVHVPNKIGMRNIKTAVTAAVCALIYYFFDRSPAFACIGVIFGMGQDLSDGYKNGGGNRLYGTIIGGLIGVLCIILFNTPVDTYVAYALNRIFDTSIGVIMALIVCYFFPMNWRRIWPERIARYKAWWAQHSQK